MNPSLSEIDTIVQEEVGNLQLQYASLLDWGNYKLVAANWNWIFFTAPAKADLVFFYETNQYNYGKYMFFWELAIRREGKITPLEDLMQQYLPGFQCKAYLAGKAEEKISTHQAYLELLEQYFKPELQQV